MGSRDRIRNVMYGAYCGGTKPGMRSVRKGDWKLIKYDVRRQGSTDSAFNLKQNPEELLAEHQEQNIISKTEISQRNFRSIWPRIRNIPKAKGNGSFY